MDRSLPQFMWNNKWFLNQLSHAAMLVISILLISTPLEAENVIINEIMYRAPKDLTELEYVELWNTSADPVDISGWRIKGVGLTISAGTVLQPNEFFVASRNADLFERIYKQTPDAVFDKSLSNGGERLSLINATGEILESVKYDDKAPWPLSADGQSASLERISTLQTANSEHNWAPSNLTATFSETPSGTPGKINSVYQNKLPPFMNQVGEIPSISQAGSNIDVSLEVEGEVKLVELLVTIIQPGVSAEETSIVMNRIGDNLYKGSISKQVSNRIIRYRFKATGINGATSLLPHPNALRPTFSTYIPGKLPETEISLMHFISTSESVSSNFETYRTQSGRRFGRGGFGPPPVESEDEIIRRDLMRRVSNEGLRREFARLTLGNGIAVKQILDLSNAFRAANNELDELRNEIGAAKDISDFQESIKPKTQRWVADLVKGCRPHLNAEQIKTLSESLLNQDTESRRARGFDPKQLVQAILNIESIWFERCVIQKPTEMQVALLEKAFSIASGTREQILADLIKQGSEPDIPSIIGRARNSSMSLNEKVRNILGEIDQQERTARGDRDNPRGRSERFRQGPGRGFGRGNVSTPVPPQGESALVYRGHDSNEILFFDHINILPRKSGYKVRLNKDRPLNNMTTLNVLFEPGDASTINEMLAYPTYALFGNTTVHSGAARVLMNGKPAGYHLWFEQPNGRFFTRNKMNADGNLYKVIWQQSNRPSPFTPESEQTERTDIVARWEKVTHPHESYEDLVNMIESLEAAQGDSAAMWKAIESQFDVDQVINYYATNLLLSHWDGFFNNYFLYHDTKDSGKWSILPWDQDSTWSLRGGSPDSLSKMPLDYGGEGARPPGAPEESGQRSRFGGRGFGGFGRGFGWWRDGDVISKSLIGNPIFFERYKARIQLLLENKFTPDVFMPIFEDLNKKLTPEIKLRAEINKTNPEDEVERFHELFDTLKQHLDLRRAYLLSELNK